MKLPDILKRWLSQAEITGWEGLVIEMEKRQGDKEAELKSNVEAQGWRLDLGAEPFVALTSSLEIKPVGGNRFEKRAPGGQWVRANPMRDFPPGDLAPLQRVSSLFVEVLHLQQAARELPAAIEEFKLEYRRHVDAARLASPAGRQEGLEQLRRFYEEQKEALPLSPRKELLEMEFTILLQAFRSADSTQESEDLREQLRNFFRKHRQSGADRWEEVFIREEHQREYRARLEELRQAASHEEIARNKAQLLAFVNKYGNHLPGNPPLEIQTAWTHALKNNLPPALPAGLRASVGREEGINLSWNKCLGATQYQIYRSESNAPESKSFLDSIPSPSTASSPDPTFLDSSAADRRDYFYWVKATNPKGESDFTDPAKGSRLKLADLLREPRPKTAPPEVTVRMMKAMEEGDIMEAIEIYTHNLAHAEIWVGVLDETLVICHENARDRMEPADAPAIFHMLEDHKSIQKKLRELILADRNPARIRTLTRISARNNAFVTELDEHLKYLNKEETGTKVTSGAEVIRLAEPKRPAEEKAGADAEPAANTSAVESQQLQEQALAEIKARCDKAETRDDIQRVEHWMREQLGKLSVPNPAWEKQLAGFVTEARKRIDANYGALADWAGVREEQEEQYVNLAIVFTDIIGSTMLNGRFGDASWDEIRSAHFRQARRLLEKSNGWYIKDVGDGVVAVFKNAVDALRFAMELEKAPGHDMVRITAGAHIGTVNIRGNDIFGNEVNLAARIQDKAGGGGVWMSEGVRAEWRSRYGPKSLHFDRHPNVELKGLDDPVTLWSLPPALPPALPDAGEPKTKPTTEPRPLADEKATVGAEEAIRHIRQLQIILTRAEAAAAAGKPEEVLILMEKHEPFREQLVPHLHQAIQTQFQVCAKEATTPQAVGALRERLQTHKAALKSQPMLVKALESLLAETEARVHGEIEIKLLEEEILAETKKRAVVAKSDEDIQLLGHWVEEQIARLPAHNPSLASQLRGLVPQAQRAPPKTKKPPGQAGLDGWKHLAMARSQAKKFAEEGDLDGLLILIADNPRWELQLVSFLPEAVGTRVRRQASYATTNADIVALEEFIEQHRPLLVQNPELAAEFDETLQQARRAVKARFKRKIATFILILMSLAAVGTVIGIMLSRQAPK